jgi:hypothetical protein
MLYYQCFTLSRIHEAEKMGKKTVPIADQTTQRRRAFIRKNGKGTYVDPVEDSFKIIPGRNDWTASSGMSMCMGGRQYISYQRSTIRERAGYVTIYIKLRYRNNATILDPLLSLPISPSSREASVSWSFGHPI